MSRQLMTISLLFLANIFMTIAWYGHLRFHDTKSLQKYSLVLFIVLSWLIALPEYCAQVPANRIGYQGNGGPFNLMQLKVLQETITLIVFFLFTVIVFKNETFRLNHLIGAALLIGAVYFFFKK